jgi:tRNA G10  N-methylase Trm11
VKISIRLLLLTAKAENLFSQKAFAISSSAGFGDLKVVAADLKKAVQANGHRFRFRLLRDLRESSGILDQYQELMFLSINKQYYCLHTQAVQSLEKWTNKDYGRPRSDPKSGMLPPKIARMMVNCALTTSPDSKTVVYDPFCGSGTILAEALDLGVSIIGSDISPQAVASASLNSQWIKDTYQLPGKTTLFVADVLSVTPKQVGGGVDAIVFEGYLGPPNIRPDQIKNFHRGLRKFYIGVLKHLKNLLKSQGRLVMALPEYHHAGLVKSYADLIDTCENYGYTQSGPIVTYGRPHATIKRMISILQKID